MGRSEIFFLKNHQRRILIKLQRLVLYNRLRVFVDHKNGQRRTEVFLIVLQRRVLIKRKGGVLYDWFEIFYNLQAKTLTSSSKSTKSWSVGNQKGALEDEEIHGSVKVQKWWFY